MARSASRRVAQPTGGAARSRVANPEDTIRAFHALGLEVLKRRVAAGLDPPEAAIPNRGGPPGPGSVQRGARKTYDEILDEVAAKHGAARDRVLKAARFARLYDYGALERLCALRTPAGQALSVEHVRRLIMIPNRKVRERLGRKAAKQGWSSDRLSREIRRLRGATPGRGGPKLRPPGTFAEGLEQVRSWSEEWLKHHDALWSGDPAWLVPDGEVDAGRLEEVLALLPRLRRAARILERTLHEAARRESGADAVPLRGHTSGKRSGRRKPPAR